jgi:hypothetical protein
MARAQVAWLLPILVGVVVAGARAEPVLKKSSPSRFERVVSCSVHTFQIAFDPRTRLTVSSGGRDLAAAMPTSRSVGSVCAVVALRTPVTSNHDPYSSAGLGPQVTTATHLSCRVPNSIRIDVHPITNSANHVIGSNLDVLVGKSNRSVAAASYKVDGSTVYPALFWASHYCTRG